MLRSLVSALFVATLCLAPASVSYGGITYSAWLNTVAPFTFPTVSATPQTVVVTRNFPVVTLSAAELVAGLNNAKVATYGLGTGGEFRVQSLDGSLVDSGDDGLLQYTNAEGSTQVYKTFCLERGEFLALNTSYEVSVDLDAWYGANDDDPGDTVDTSTKILYGLYYRGLLDNEVGTFAYQDPFSADDLQNAIWAIEDNLAVGDLTANALALYTYATTDPDTLGAFYATRVGALNLWDDSLGSIVGEAEFTERIQSQLIWVGLPEIIEVPEPASMVVWSLGLLGMAGFGLRRKSAQRQ